MHVIYRPGPAPQNYAARPKAAILASAPAGRIFLLRGCL